MVYEQEKGLPAMVIVHSKIGQFLKRLLLGIWGLVWNRYVFFLAVMYGYTLTVQRLGGVAGGMAFFYQYLEVPLVMYLYLYFNLIIRPSRWQPYLAAAPILLAYIGQDIYYMMLGKIFRMADFAEVSELLKVMSLKYLVLVALAIGGTAVGFALLLNWRRKLIMTLGAMPIAALIAYIMIFPQHFNTTFLSVCKEIIDWNDERPVSYNGRFAILMYRESERRIARSRTALFHDRETYNARAMELATWLKQMGTGKNIHLIIMESFLDPTLLRGAEYSKDPVHPKYKKLFGDKLDKLGYSISPVFGGRTCQAEFEVLCGVPAFQELGGVEFNSFTGTQAFCMPGIFREAGYESMVTNSFDPAFFNAVNAYKGIGFDSLYFPKEFNQGSESYVSMGDVKKEMYMFDGDLFAQNLKFVQEYLQKEDRKPLFNYVITMYGHLPYLLDEEKRPGVLKVTSKTHDGNLERATNQFYYRSEAVAEHVSNLMKADPDSMIVIVSDHLPPLLGSITYKQLRYLDNRDESLFMNRIIIVEGQKIKKYATVHHYDIPKLIFNYLSDGKYCAENTCKFKENKVADDRQDFHDQYLTLMAHAIE